MSGISANLCSRKAFVNFGKNQKSWGAELGEFYIFVMDFLARNLRTLNVSWAEA
jgi:hypothetical protein